MIGPPRSREAEIAVAERASERDLTDVGGRRERRRGGFERRERARNLAGLMIDPFRLVPLGRTPAAFVDQKNRGIHQTVGEGLQAQSGKARARIGRDDAAAAGAMIEIVEDHSRIEQHRAVLEHERRNLAQWILLPHRVVRIHRIRGLDGDVAIEAEHARGNAHLTDKRRGGRAAQRQHGDTISMRVTGSDSQATAWAASAPTSGGLADQPVMTRLTAFGPLPFLSGSTSKERRCPSVNDLSPARSTAVTCTNTSRPPSSGLMKP